jgi:hypothetical protein
MAHLGPTSFLQNDGTISISVGASLNIESTFVNQSGTLLVKGILINSSDLSTSQSSRITVHGTFENKNKLANNMGVITIESGGHLINTGFLSNICPDSAGLSGQIVVKNGGTLINKTPGVLQPCSVITGRLINKGTFLEDNGSDIITFTSENTAYSFAMTKPSITHHAAHPRIEPNIILYNQWLN